MYKQYWGKARDWRWLADVRRQLQVAQCIVVTAMRPDMVLHSECERIVYFIGFVYNSYPYPNLGLYPQGLPHQPSHLLPGIACGMP